MNETKCPYCQLQEDILKNFKYEDKSYMSANIHIHPNMGPIIYIEHMKKEKYGELGCNAWFKINYCPFCGKLLRKE